MNQPFKIKAKSCTLLGNQDSTESLLTSNLKFEIPVFQRPYSWSDEQVEKLLNDILTTFENPASQNEADPLFIGTMQLGKPKDGIQEIIDGQQRLTTLLLTFKVLTLMFSQNTALKSVQLNWIQTRVSNGQQQAKLDRVMNLRNVGQLQKDSEALDNTNTYERNARLLYEILGTYFAEQKNSTERTTKLVHYMLHSLYFVVIETHAGLSKTLQIFDAINTTGLDLNGGDIFKIRMYEYLTSIKKVKEEGVFDRISALYEKIEKYTAEIKEDFMTMRSVLGIYQYYLIGHYDLPKELYSYSATRFFEELFDTLFGISKDGHFKNHISKIHLSLEKLDDIIEARYDWEKNWWSKKYFTEEDVCLSHFLWGSRYPTYWRLITIFNMELRSGNMSEEERWKSLQSFNKSLTRFLYAYSIIYARAVNSAHREIYKVNELICKGQLDDAPNRLHELMSHHELRAYVENKLNGEITSNAKAKYMICRLAAMLEEDYKVGVQVGEKFRTRLEALLFNPDYPLDIEHIESVNHEDNTKREGIWEEWGSNMNSIGNLIVLEREINRNIKNKSFSKVKRFQYKDESKFTCVNSIGAQPDWTLDDCKNRKSSTTSRIIKYIFDYSTSTNLPQTNKEALTK